MEIMMFTKIRRWASPPVFDGDYEKTRAALLLNIVVWMFIGASSAYGLLAPIHPQYLMRRLIIIGPFVVVLIALKFLLNFGYVRAVAQMIVLTMWTIFTAAMFFGADYNNPAFMGYLVVVVTAGLILNWRAAIGWSILSILTNAVIITLGQLGYLNLSHGDTPPFAFWAAQTVYIIVTTALLSQATRKIDEALANAQHELGERERVESERESFIKELESKNAELERFTYTVSHDLKSPLITIGGYLGFLEKDAHQGRMDKFNSDVERIREATGKMQILLNDLLELSRIGRLMNPPEEIGFESIVRDALALVDGSLREKNVHVIVHENLPTVYGDRIRLVEVVQNLLDNAAKFMGDQTERQIEVGMRIENGEHVFFVKDNGVGIDTQHHERIFGLFNKLDTETEGTGVGLALVKRTVEVHEGRIWVESNVGEGTSFCFTLPKKSL
jgi:signal transduction histidine kinase